MTARKNARSRSSAKNTPSKALAKKRTTDALRFNTMIAVLLFACVGVGVLPTVIESVRPPTGQLLDPTTHLPDIKSMTATRQFEGPMSEKPGKWAIRFLVPPPKQVVPGQTYGYVVHVKSRLAPQYNPDREWTLLVSQSPVARFIQRIDERGNNIGTRCTQTHQNPGFPNSMYCDMLGVTDELYYMMATVSEHAPCGSKILHTASAEGYKSVNSPYIFKFQKNSTSTVACPKKSESDLEISVTGNFLNKKSRQILNAEAQKGQLNFDGSVLEQRFVVRNTGKKTAKKVILSALFQPLKNTMNAGQRITENGEWSGFLSPFIKDKRCKYMNQFMHCALGDIAPGKEVTLTQDLEATPNWAWPTLVAWNMYQKNKALGLCPNAKLICEWKTGLPDGNPVTYLPATTHAYVRGKEQDADQSDNAAIGHWEYSLNAAKFVDLRHQAFFTKEIIGAGEETTLVLHVHNSGNMEAKNVGMRARATVRVPVEGSRDIGNALVLNLREEDKDICRLTNYGLTSDTVLCFLSSLKPGEGRDVKINVKMPRERKCLPSDKAPPLIVLAELPHIYPGTKLTVESDSFLAQSDAFQRWNASEGQTWTEGSRKIFGDRVTHEAIKTSPPLLYGNPYQPRSMLEIPINCGDAAKK